MLIEPKPIMIEEYEFILNPMKTLKAMRMDKKVITLLVPVMGSLEGNQNQEQQIDFNVLSEGIGTALESLDDNQFEKFIIEILAEVQYKQTGQPVQSMTATVIDTKFRGDLLVIYKLIFEVVKFNRFLPFVIAGGGKGISEIFS